MDCAEGLRKTFNVTGEMGNVRKQRPFPDFQMTIYFHKISTAFFSWYTVLCFRYSLYNLVGEKEAYNFYHSLYSTGVSSGNAKNLDLEHVWKR